MMVFFIVEGESLIIGLMKEDILDYFCVKIELY